MKNAHPIYNKKVIGNFRKYISNIIITIIL